MAHKGPAAPSQPRTLRGIALEKGTSSSGFDANATTYYPQGGHPVGEGMPAQEYKEAGPATKTGGQQPIQGPAFTTKK